MESNRVRGRRGWSDMDNNFHYVSLTLSYSLINSPLAVIGHCVLEHRETSQVILSHWIWYGFGLTVVKQQRGEYCWQWYSKLRWGFLVETNISVCFCRVSLSFPRLLFIDHSLLPDTICLSLSHIAGSWKMFPFVSSALLSLTILCRISMKSTNGSTLWLLIWIHFCHVNISIVSRLALFFLACLLFFFHDTNCLMGVNNNKGFYRIKKNEVQNIFYTQWAPKCTTAELIN